MVMNPFDYREREIFRQLFHKIMEEHRQYGKTMSSEIFTQRVFNNIEIAIKNIREVDREKTIRVLQGMKLEKRGKEECDCSESLGNCGCSVKDYNDAVEENNFATDLAVNSLKNIGY